MRAKDIMTSPAITVGPEVKVSDIAKLLMERRISAVPVVDDAGRLVGIVSEGDLMMRLKSESGDHRSWWLRLAADPVSEAQHYVKAQGQYAREVMTRHVVTASEDTPIAEIATTLEERAIKRVPIVRDGEVVGIVSRANLLQGLAAVNKLAALSDEDSALRAALDRAIDESGIRTTQLNIVAAGGVAHLWGAVESRDELEALTVALENTTELDKVESHVRIFSPASVTFVGGV